MDSHTKECAQVQFAQLHISIWNETISMPLLLILLIQQMQCMYIIFYYSIYYIMFIYMDMETDNGCTRSKVSKVPLPTILSATTVVTNIKIQSEKCELIFCINRHVGWYDVKSIFLFSSFFPSLLRIYLPILVVWSHLCQIVAIESNQTIFPFSFS